MPYMDEREIPHFAEHTVETGRLKELIDGCLAGIASLRSQIDAKQRDLLELWAKYHAAGERYEAARRWIRDEGNYQTEVVENEKADGKG